MSGRERSSAIVFQGKIKYVLLSHTSPFVGINIDDPGPVPGDTTMNSPIYHHLLLGISIVYPRIILARWYRRDLFLLFYF